MDNIKPIYQTQTTPQLNQRILQGEGDSATYSSQLALAVEAGDVALVTDILKNYRNNHKYGAKEIVLTDADTIRVFQQAFAIAVKNQKTELAKMIMSSVSVRGSSQPKSSSQILYDDEHGPNFSCLSAKMRWAANHGYISEIQSGVNGNTVKVETLHETGADGKTALRIAVEKGSLEAVQSLMQPYIHKRYVRGDVIEFDGKRIMRGTFYLEDPKTAADCYGVIVYAVKHQAAGNAMKAIAEAVREPLVVRNKQVRDMPLDSCPHLLQWAVQNKSFWMLRAMKAQDSEGLLNVSQNSDEEAASWHILFRVQWQNQTPENNRIYDRKTLIEQIEKLDCLWCGVADNTTMPPDVKLSIQTEIETQTSELLNRYHPGFFKKQFPGDLYDDIQNRLSSLAGVKQPTSPVMIARGNIAKRQSIGTGSKNIVRRFASLIQPSCEGIELRNRPG